MRYIKKFDTPQFFIDDTNALSLWNEYLAQNKRKLRKYILENEQNSLCCYCEGKISVENSHLEHIKPKSLDPLTLTFEYSNISVSCNGICDSGNEREYCGHKKENGFDENKFLNPTVIENIREYFKYENDGEIKSSGINNEKVLYTILLLQLNTFNNYLQEARKKALVEFREAVTKKAKATGKDLKEIAVLLLNQERLAYISFLRYRHKDLLKENI
ncbi:MAG: TIGR02646 family protein [Arcobacteraceae bacterium]|nr:TIGR02646 family protein [Arcobacteraceae bacterium]